MSSFFCFFFFQGFLKYQKSEMCKKGTRPAFSFGNSGPRQPCSPFQPRYPSLLLTTGASANLSWRSQAVGCALGPALDGQLVLGPALQSAGPNGGPGFGGHHSAADLHSPCRGGQRPQRENSPGKITKTPNSDIKMMKLRIEKFWYFGVPKTWYMSNCTNLHINANRQRKF